MQVYIDDAGQVVLVGEHCDHTLSTVEANVLGATLMELANQAAIRRYGMRPNPTILGAQ